MDFFARQDKARRHTKLLVFYFILAVLLIIASVYLAILLVFTGLSHRAVFGDWHLLAYVAMGTLAVIVCGSLFKLAELGGGGKTVALSLGGRLVPADTTDLDERKLLNVVEEMAIAAGLPVPQVYVLDQERAINAFAAGHTPGDAIIGVTRGCMKQLSRDELQGVIGHEFSHILNGDMRLNIRLIGIVFGILCITVIGRILLYSGYRSSYRLGARNRGSNNALPLLGLLLIAIGAIGVFFGRLIQAAVSRQREFLADASSVQFTRNPAGLSGALQKLGGAGSRIASPHAETASHMFFGNGLKESLFGAMATHPPLKDRIRAIDPNWDGQFKPLVEVEEERPTAKGKTSQALDQLLAGVVVPATVAASAAGRKPPGIRPQTVMPHLGNPTPLHLRYAEQLRNAFPESVKSAAHGPLTAVALIYAMLLSREEPLRSTQLQELSRRTPATIHENVAALAGDAAAISQRARLPLVNLTLPALRMLRPPEFEEFKQTMKWLIESDQQIDLFEYVLQKILRRQLEPHFTRVRQPVTQYYSIRPLVPDCAVVLSALAHVGQEGQAEIEKAFQEGVPYLRARGNEVRLLQRSECALPQIDAALDRLVQAAPQLKKNLIEASVHVVGADGVIQEREAEMLRAVADTLDCPIPPFVQIEQGEQASS